MAMIDSHIAGPADLNGSAILERSRSAPHRNTSDAPDLELQQRLVRSVVVDNYRLISTPRDRRARALQCNRFGNSYAARPCKRPGRERNRIAIGTEIGFGLNI